MNLDEVLDSLAGLPTRHGLMEKFITPAEAHLIARVKDFSADDQKRLATKKLKTVDGFIEVSKNIKGASNIQELINGQDEEVGICSLDKGNVPTGDNYSIKEIFMHVGAHATETNPAAVSYSQSPIAGDFAALYNSTITIWADTTLLLKAPMASFVLNLRNMTSGILKLDKPIFLKGDEQLEIKIEFPKGVAMPTTKELFVKYLMKGIKTSKR